MQMAKESKTPRRITKTFSPDIRTYYEAQSLRQCIRQRDERKEQKAQKYYT